ncbi:MAG: alpha/beta hydrolase [Gemmatimonadota bacterium]
MARHNWYDLEVTSQAVLVRRSRWVRRGIQGIVAIGAFALILVASGATYESVGSARDLRRYPPPGRMIDVGGYRLHLVCEGTGSPTVVMDAGLGDSWLAWGSIQPVIARSTRVCSYDRAGLGYSDAGPTPRGSAQIVRELHALLTAAQLSPPYVLVGHSFGGLNVRLFTYTYPSEVAALVLVDPSHEEQFPQWTASESDAYDGYLSEMRHQATRAVFGLQRLTRTSAADTNAAAASQRPLAITLGYRHQWFQTLRDEFESFRTRSPAEVRAARRPLDIPLYVVDGSYLPEGLRPGSTQSDADSNRAVWHRLHRELAQTSSNGHLIVAERSSHYVQFDQPDLVVQAITDAVATVRHSASSTSTEPRE